MEDISHSLAAIKLDPTNADAPDELSLMDLPVEVQLKIIRHCLNDVPRRSKPDNGILGRHVRRDERVLLGGSLRDLTLVNQHFRRLTAPILFQSICINDASEATREDKLRDTHEALVGLPTYNWLQHMEKFTISLGRTPNPHKPYAGQDFIELLSYMQWPTTMRYVLEKQDPTYTVLNDVRSLLLKWRRWGMDFLVFKVRQLELSCPWGSHSWDFQFLTWPYLNMERLWLDYDTHDLRPQSLALEKLRNLEYVMHRAHPTSFLKSDIEVDVFKGLTAPDGRRPPKLRQLCHTMQQVKHFALCGLLKGPVTEIAALVRDMRSLEQLDITDQQAISDDEVHASTEQMLHPISEIDWAIKHSRCIEKHPKNIDRAAAATVFFNTLPKLQRICFVRDQIGTFYHAIRDENTGALDRVEKGEMIQERHRYLCYPEHSSVWRCGFPNRLNYDLWGRTQNRFRFPTEYAFWLNPAYLAGDESAVPPHLRFAIALKEVFGTMPPEEEERIARLNAHWAQRDRQDEERRRSRRRGA
ncbi:hypothetical protein M406DRAFT_68011 [Cryphonectria parasitica EP155]|uniref:Uncharacterized protein n=1 Tax=Cryphonectria parasitica (strain ATCC 38755 / EP155) TaxID=660469 RepID=A0A9P4Y2T5_CRYP1|nr:uncharacterized protein M406DRAFT_68011 [Cryphonectria parasitica EP155]KAF3765586.1 hypothetical protein M406DRAFT_68011 [Cryphonectria parasitica EP155]